jgi:hypothetical protein
MKMKNMVNENYVIGAASGYQYIHSSLERILRRMDSTAYANHAAQKLKKVASNRGYFYTQKKGEIWL